MKQDVVDLQKKKIGEVELADEIFAVKPNKALIYEVATMLLNNQRRGTASARTVSTISGTTAKIYRQKGTGRARHGSLKRNIYVGGAKAFGPHPRDYEYSLPKKARRAGLRSMLALKCQEGKIVVIDKLEPKEIKTKAMKKVFETLEVNNGVIVIDGLNEKLQKSVRNLPDILLLRNDELNVVDLLRHEHVVFVKNALPLVVERLKP